MWRSLNIALEFLLSLSEAKPEKEVFLCAVRPSLRLRKKNIEPSMVQTREGKFGN